MWIICFQPQKGKYRVSLQKECHDLAVGKMHVRRSSVQASCTQWVQINYEVAWKDFVKVPCFHKLKIEQALF